MNRAGYNDSPGVCARLARRRFQRRTAEHESSGPTSTSTLSVLELAEQQEIRFSFPRCQFTCYAARGAGVTPDRDAGVDVAPGRRAPRLAPRVWARGARAQDHSLEESITSPAAAPAPPERKTRSRRPYGTTHRGVRLRISRPGERALVASVG